MGSNRRQFIRTAGAGTLGLGLAPLLSRAGFGRGGGFGQAENGKQGFERAGSWWGGEDPWTFPRASPESQGVRSLAIREFLSAANASEISWHSFILIRHGKVVAEGWWRPFESQWVHSLYSLSKSFTSTAIGLLVKEGKLDIHAPVVSFFPKDLPAKPSENLQHVTVRHLLTMNTGHGEDTMPKMRASQEAWTKTWLAQPVEFTPGSHFLYNTGNTYMLGAIIHALTGETLEKYLGPRLFEPLGITGYDWEVSPQGLNTGGYGLRVKTEDIAKLGQLYLQKGIWRDETILPAAWVQEATSRQTDSQTGDGDWSQGYGYQFWRCTHGFFRGDGAYGQFCIVMPELDAVLAVTGQSPDMQKSMNIIWDHLPGGMQAGVLPENRGEQTALANALADLSLPVARGSIVSPYASRYDKKKWTMDSNEFGIKGLELAFSEKGCRLSVDTGARRSNIDFGWESWKVNPEREVYVFKAGDLFPMPSRIAGTATWVGGGRELQLNTRFVEAIFGDSIRCRFDGDKIAISFLNSVAETVPNKPDPRKELTGRAM